MAYAAANWDLIARSLWGTGALCCLLAAAGLLFHPARFGKANASQVAALAATGLWAALGSFYGPESALAMLGEGLRNLAWLFALYRLFEVDGRHAAMRPVRPLLAVLAVVELALLIVRAVLAIRLDPASALAAGFHTIAMLHLLVVTGGLVLLHNLYGGASSQSRRLLRWPALALALLWVVDLNFFAIGYLAEGVPAMLGLLRGVLALPVALLLGLGSGLAGEVERFRPSRAVTFQSASFLLIGGYLAALVAAAQWLAFAGRDSASLLQLGFVALVLAIALLLLPSSRLRGWLRVTLAKHLFQHRYDYRAEWLRFTHTIGRAGDKEVSLHERVIRAIADITDSPAGMLLTLAEGGRLELAARWQWPTAQVPAAAIEPELSARFERDGYIADLDELRAGHGGTCGPDPIPAWLLDDPRAWALVPLLHYERLVGMVVLARPAFSRRLDWEDFDLLRITGQQLASYLAEHAGQAALAEASRFDDFHRRIAFVIHDIKNLASQLSLLARNAELHAANPDFRADMLVTLRNSADKLNLLLARLSRYGPAAIETLGPVRADEIAQAVLKQLEALHPLNLVEVEPCTVAADRESLEQVLLHLVQNAIDASSGAAAVFIRVAPEGLNGVIEVIDSGTGMSAEFVRTRLFRPFDSTKPGGFGIGAYEARELIRAMHGRVEVESREGLGTRFVIRLPLAETAQIIETLAGKRVA